jgi:hypothetical protein
VQASNVVDVGHGAGEDAQALEDMVPRDLRDLDAAHGHLGQGPLQRILGLGSYETAWTWLHKLRSAMVRSDSEPLGPFVEMNEALVGGKGGLHKQLVLAATEKGGRVRLAHAANSDAETCKRFADGEVAGDGAVTTDGHAGYNETSLGERAHDAVVQTKAEKRGRRRASLPLGDLAVEALADWHACGRGSAKAPAGVPR